VKPTATDCPQYKHSWIYGHQRRPSFADAAAYLEHCHEAVRTGKDIWPPVTIDEFLALEATYPDRARRFRPPAQWREAIGLPDDYCETVEPIDRRMRRAIVAAIQIDPDFCAEIASLIKGAM